MVNNLKVIVGEGTMNVLYKRTKIEFETVQSLDHLKCFKWNKPR